MKPWGLHDLYTGPDDPAIAVDMAAVEALVEQASALAGGQAPIG